MGAVLHYVGDEVPPAVDEDGKRYCAFIGQGGRRCGRGDVHPPFMHPPTGEDFCLEHGGVPCEGFTSNGHRCEQMVRHPHPGPPGMYRYQICHGMHISADDAVHAAGGWEMGEGKRGSWVVPVMLAIRPGKAEGLVESTAMRPTGVRKRGANGAVRVGAGEVSAVGTGSEPGGLIGAPPRSQLAAAGWRPAEPGGRLMAPTVLDAAGVGLRPPGPVEMTGASGGESGVPPRPAKRTKGVKGGSGVPMAASEKVVLAPSSSSSGPSASSAPVVKAGGEVGVVQRLQRRTAGKRYTA